MLPLWAQINNCIFSEGSVALLSMKEDWRFQVLFKVRGVRVASTLQVHWIQRLAVQLVFLVP